ncbi:hypothetical protein QTO34_001378 [Cnephaeus nilssonii]|uniref:Uncharacterized protein n=1 Tax=Cnephaeus nilssonii TaxID=3371016 RepID=A0AA40LNJ3_CNENI|nr:hypothetical protein QTO34_001378 [Eptesicus nilssonii]
MLLAPMDPDESRTTAGWWSRWNIQIDHHSTTKMAAPTANKEVVCKLTHQRWWRPSRDTCIVTMAKTQAFIPPHPGRSGPLDSELRQVQSGWGGEGRLLISSGGSEGWWKLQEGGRARAKAEDSSSWSEDRRQRPERRPVSQELQKMTLAPKSPLQLPGTRDPGRLHPGRLQLQGYSGQVASAGLQALAHGTVGQPFCEAAAEDTLALSVAKENPKKGSRLRTTIIFIWQDGSVVQFKIKSHTPLRKLIEACCEQQATGTGFPPAPGTRAASLLRPSTGTRDLGWLPVARPQTSRRLRVQQGRAAGAKFPGV